MNLTGVMLTVSYAVVISINSVMIAHLVREISPAVLAFGCFLISTVLFQMMRFLISYNGRVGLAKLWAVGSRKLMLRLNVYTAVTWLGLFYAVQYIRPSVNAMVVNALGPLLMVLAWGRLRPRVPPLRAEKIATVGIFSSMLMLVASSLSHHASASLNIIEIAIGFLIAGVCGGLQTATVVTNKALLELGHNVIDILSNRYLLTIMIASLLALSELTGEQDWFRHAPYMVLLAITFVALPAVLLQFGLKHLEPVTVTIILFSIPMITAVFELFDPGHTFDLQTFIGVMLGVFSLLFGVFSRLRLERDI